ncbi:MAG: HD domain-containing protein, partial [Bacillota bacterium]
MVELDRRARAHMLHVKERGRERGYRYHHGVRVARIAATLAREAGVADGVDHEVLEAAARLHDIGKDGVTKDHARVGAELVAAWFADLLGDKTEAVRTAVF